MRRFQRALARLFPGLVLACGALAMLHPAAAKPNAAWLPAATGYPGMPPVLDANDLHSAAGPDQLSLSVRPALPPNDIVVIDPHTRKVLTRFPVGANLQHAIAAWDLRTFWVTNNAERRKDGSLTPIDPNTGNMRERWTAACASDA